MNRYRWIIVLTGWISFLGTVFFLASGLPCESQTMAPRTLRSDDKFPPIRKSGPPDANREAPRRLGLLAPDMQTAVITRVPCAAFADGIELAVISPRSPRYPNGAPILVMVTPPLSSFRPSPADKYGFTALGFAVINIGYPEGKAFDRGGPNTKRGIADALLFAMGKRRDVRNRAIGDIATLPVLTNLVGIIGWSHGGNAAITTLETFPLELKDLAFYVSYESPAGTSQDTLGDSVLADYGRTLWDTNPVIDSDGDGFPWDDARNPHYRPDTGLDLSRLTWDGNAVWNAMGGGKDRDSQQGVLFLDGNRDGRFNVVIARPSFKETPHPNDAGIAQPMNPRPTCDINGNGSLDQSEDFPFSNIQSEDSGTIKRCYSLGVTRAARATVFRQGFPSNIADLAQAEAFWKERDMAAHFDRLAPFAGMLACICAGRGDHVQAQPDYPHIRAQYNGLQKAGVAWVKLNPDPVYATAFLEKPPAAFPCNRPNQPLPPDTIWQMTTPTRGPLGAIMVAAAATELSDRVRFQNKDSPLPKVLAPVRLKELIATMPLMWDTSKLTKP